MVGEPGSSPSPRPRKLTVSPPPDRSMSLVKSRCAFESIGIFLSGPLPVCFQVTGDIMLTPYHHKPHCTICAHTLQRLLRGDALLPLVLSFKLIGMCSAPLLLVPPLPASTFLMYWQYCLKRCLVVTFSAPSPSLPPNFRGIRPPSRAASSALGDSATAAAALDAATATSEAAAALEARRGASEAAASERASPVPEASEAQEAGELTA